MRANQTDTKAIARAFVEARHNARGLSSFPGAMPQDMPEAYAIQDAALALDGRMIGGWKLGRINPPFDVPMGAQRLAGPIFVDTVLHGDTADLPVIADGFGAAEAEFLLRLGIDADPARMEWSTEDARALIDAVHIGIEIASSPFPGINENGPAVTAADFGNNFGLLVGAALPGWVERDLNDITVTTRINGEAVGEATAATMLDGPWGALRFLVELLNQRGIPLRKGQWISTGAVTGVHPVKPGDEVEAHFDNQTIACRITAAAPRRESGNVGSASDGG